MGADAARPDHYAPAAKWLHWIMAIIVLALIPAGIAIANMPDGPSKDRLYDLHRSFGLLIFALALVRLVVRLVHGAPAPYAGLTTMERVLSGAVHHLLYLMLLVMPLVGWAAVSSFGASFTFFGLFELPALVAKNEALSKTLARVHMAGGIFMALLVMMHIAGALMHTFVKRDTVLWRMLPRSWG